MSEFLIKVMYGTPYISMFLTTTGILFQIFYKNKYLSKWGIFYFSSLLCMEVISEVYPKFIGESNLFLMSIYSYVCFLFIFYLYLVKFYKKSKYIVFFFFIFAIPTIIHSFIEYSIVSFHSYDKVFYSISLMLLSMTDIYLVVAGRVKYSSSRLFLAYTILIFYSFETLVSIPSNFLINGNIELTVWIWFLRALALQSYYVALIIFIKNSDRIRSSFLLDSR